MLVCVSSKSCQFTRQAYLWLVACMYMFSFGSLYTQIPGLYGPNGLTPVHSVLPRQSENTTWYQHLLAFPSLLLFHELLQLTSSHCMELLCCLGAVLACVMMVFRAMRCTLLFAVLWIFYLSVHKVGQVFLWFQWDSLLLEAGFLTILIAPFNLKFWKKPVCRSHDGLMLWLAKWLLFRLMFASGVVKLTSQCPTWWGLTALDYHYESQCIPTPLAWYAHQLPEWFQKMSVVGTYFIEIATPFLFLFPVRSLRLFGFWSQIFLQVLIMATGNYNFFNLLTITLCFSLVEDSFFGQKTDSDLSPTAWLLRVVFRHHNNMIHRTVRWLVFSTVVGVLLALTVFYFDIKLNSDDWSMMSSIRFTPESFQTGLSATVPLCALLGALSLSFEILGAFWSSCVQSGFWNKMWSLVQSTTFSGIAVVMFSISLVSLGVLDRTFYNSIPPEVRSFHDTLDQYSVTNPYGLFRRMTGVGGRPEIIIEGTSDSQTGEWKEYEFLYKPGDMKKPPLYCAPHQPRLDWQMWFAALGTYQNNPWLVHLVYRLLIGQQEVIQLLGHVPFQHPPRQVRVRLYHYHFTPYDSGNLLFNQTLEWWSREFKNEYLFPLTWDNPELVGYLHKYNYLAESNLSYPSSLLQTSLTRIRIFTDQFSPPSILWTLFSAAIIASLTMSLTCADSKEGESGNKAGHLRKKCESTVVHQSGEEYDSDTLDGKMLHIKKRAVAE